MVRPRPEADTMALNPYVTIATALAKTETGRSTGRKVGWGATQWVAAFGAGLLAKKAISAAWTSTRGTEPPANPADPTVDWTEAIGWSLAIGVGYGVARTLGKRAAAATWQAATGDLPPGFDDDPTEGRG